jgi:hypothetical protein
MKKERDAGASPLADLKRAKHSIQEKSSICTNTSDRMQQLNIKQLIHHPTLATNPDYESGRMH